LLIGGGGPFCTRAIDVIDRGDQTAREIRVWEEPGQYGQSFTSNSTVSEVMTMPSWTVCLGETGFAMTGLGRQVYWQQEDAIYRIFLTVGFSVTIS